ncbi:MAG TPA: hypothetical protein VFA40_26320 [Terriglobales bacterium]|nr:hypothetical protein [Terriglobales bacterium]
MAGIPLTRKLRILAQVAGQHAGSNRTMGAVFKAGQVTLRSFGRVLHQLWLEVTGFVFLVLAAIGGVALNREYAKYHAGHGELLRVVIAVCFCVTFGYFGVSSFWRVRRKKQG